MEDKKKGRNKVVFTILLIVVLGALALLLFLKLPRNSKDSTTVVIQESTGEFTENNTEPSSESTDNIIVFDTEFATESSVQSMCDSYVCLIFSGSKTDMVVSSELSDTIDSKLSAISPNGGFVARQATISSSGLEVKEEGYGYLAVLDVYCMDRYNVSSKFNVVVRLDLSSNCVVEGFELYSFR